MEACQNGRWQFKSIVDLLRRENKYSVFDPRIQNMEEYEVITKFRLNKISTAEEKEKEFIALMRKFINFKDNMKYNWEKKVDVYLHDEQSSYIIPNPTSLNINTAGQHELCARAAQIAFKLRSEWTDKPSEFEYLIKYAQDNSIDDGPLICALFYDDTPKKIPSHFPKLK